jgi:hypothetical protein
MSEILVMKKSGLNIRNFAMGVLGLLDLDSIYYLKSDGFLRNAGWFKSFRAKIPIDQNDDPIPWFTYPSIRFIEKRINKDMVVFEYGCGNSTLWWAIASSRSFPASMIENGMKK